MAPSSGNLLVPKALKLFKYAVSKTAALIRQRLPASQATALEPIPIRIVNQPLHHLAAIRQAHSRQQQNRFLSTLRRLASTPVASVARGGTAAARGPSPLQISRTVLSRPTSIGFTSPLRPNLALGAFPRSTLGGVRQFSSAPTVHAQVVQNVSSAVRAFWCEGKRARFDGVDSRGEKRWKAVTETQDKALGKAFRPQEKGTWLEWRLNPTITALPLFQSTISQALLASAPHTQQTFSLNEPALLNGLAVDFAKTLKSLASTLSDLQRLAELGDLPVSLNPSDPSVLRVRFSGCDGETVSRLCEEIGIRSGVVREDEAWTTSKDGQMALLFPFAPSTDPSDHHAEEDSDMGDYFQAVHKKQNPPAVDWRGMMSSSEADSDSGCRRSRHYSIKEATSQESFLGSPAEKISLPSSGNPWLDLEDESLGDDDYRQTQAYEPRPYHLVQDVVQQQQQESVDDDVLRYDGIEGIYRFLAECDGARRL